MALKKYKPMTAGTRWRIGNAYAEITSDTPEKTLLEKVKPPVAVTSREEGLCAISVVVIRKCTV